MLAEMHACNIQNVILSLNSKTVMYDYYNIDRLLRAYVQLPSIHELRVNDIHIAQSGLLPNTSIRHTMYIKV